MTWSSHHWPIVVCLKSRSLNEENLVKVQMHEKKRPFLNIWLVALPYICENWENLLHFFICICNFCDLKSFFIPNFLGIEYFLVYKWLRKKRKLNHHNYLNILLDLLLIPYYAIILVHVPYYGFIHIIMYIYNMVLKKHLSKQASDVSYIR